MPLVRVVDQHHAQEEEDDRVGRRAEHLDEVLDGDERLVRHVGEGVVGLHQAAADGAALRHRSQSTTRLTAPTSYSASA